MTNSNTQQNVSYFNVHTEGLAFINAIKLVQPENGQSFTPFLTANVTFVEGKPDQPSKQYYSLTIADKLEELVSLLVKHKGSIENSDIAVFAGLKIANMQHEPFVYGPQSQTPGKLGINHSARLIGINFIKVGENTVYTRQPKEAGAASAVPRQVVSNATQQQGAELFDQALEVKVSRNDVTESDRAHLEAYGYRYHDELNTYLMPSVKLEKGDPQFVAKKTLLKQMGYRYDGKANVWNMTFGRGSAPKSQNDVTAPTATSASSDVSARSAALFGQSLVYSLNKNDMDFDEKREALKANRYRFNGESKMWMSGSVTLGKDDAQFEAKKSLLKELGYQFNSKTSQWDMPSGNNSYAKKSAYTPKNAGLATLMAG